MILYKRLGQLRDKYGVSWDLLEQDYLLSWVLVGMKFEKIWLLNNR